MRAAGAAEAPPVRWTPPPADEEPGQGAFGQRAGQRPSEGAGPSAAARDMARALAAALSRGAGVRLGLRGMETGPAAGEGGQAWLMLGDVGRAGEAWTVGLPPSSADCLLEWLLGGGQRQAGSPADVPDRRDTQAGASARAGGEGAGRRPEHGNADGGDGASATGGGAGRNAGRASGAEGAGRDAAADGLAGASMEPAGVGTRKRSERLPDEGGQAAPWQPDAAPLAVHLGCSMGAASASAALLARATLEAVCEALARTGDATGKERGIARPAPAWREGAPAGDRWWTVRLGNLADRDGAGAILWVQPPEPRGNADALAADGPAGEAGRVRADWGPALAQRLAAVEVPIGIRLAGWTMPLGEVGGLEPGALLMLPPAPDVEVVAGGRVIARLPASVVGAAATDGRGG